MINRSLTNFTINSVEEEFSDWSSRSEKSLYSQRETIYETDSFNASKISGLCKNPSGYNTNTLVRSAYDWNKV